MLNIIDGLDVRALGRPGREAVIRPPWNDVKMQVEHRLFGVWTACIQYVDPARPKSRPHGFREPLDKEHGGIQGFIINVKEINGVFEGSDQAMSRCQESIARHEGDRSVRLVYDDGGRPSCDDLTKDAVHVETMAHWSIGPT